MLWEKTSGLVGNLHYGQKVEKILRGCGGVKGVVSGGKNWLVWSFEPKDPDYLNVVENLRYKDFITVAVILKMQDQFPDNWIYVHDEEVRVGRIQNFKNWSPEMVPDPELTCLGLEYFVFEGDDLWNAKDADLLTMAGRELQTLGLAKATEVLDGTVIREKKAYPVYDDAYAEAVTAVRRFLSEEVPNLQCVGRNGMHRYNNQDHSMLTGILAARNIMKPGEFNLWDVNADEDFHEDGFRLTKEAIDKFEESQPAVPHKIPARTT